MHNSKDAPTNPRGIPYAPFVDKVEDYVSSRAEVDGTMKSFQEMISSVPPRPIARITPGGGHLTRCLTRKYQFMEVNTQRRSAGLKDKIPDIQKTLDTVRFLKTREVPHPPPAFPSSSLPPHPHLSHNLRTQTQPHL